LNADVNVGTFLPVPLSLTLVGLLNLGGATLTTAVGGLASESLSHDAAPSKE